MATRLSSLNADAPDAGHAELHDIVVTHGYYDSLPSAVRKHLVCRVVDTLEPITQKHDSRVWHGGRVIGITPPGSNPAKLLMTDTADA